METLVKLPYVKDLHTSFSLGEVKAGAALPLAHLGTAPDPLHRGATLPGLGHAPPIHRLLDALLTTEPLQRARLSQAGLAMLLLAAAVVAMNYFAWIGVARALPVRWWSLATLVGMAVFYGLIRSGWSRRRGDPSLTMPMMIFALGSGELANALLGAGRGAASRS